MAPTAGRLHPSRSSAWRATRIRIFTGGIAILVGVLAGADPKAALWLLGVVIICGVVVAALHSVRLAWVLYFSGVCANGLLIAVGPLAMRLEFFLLPVLGLSVWAHSRKVNAVEPRQKADGVLGIVICLWLLYIITISALNAPQPGKSLWMAIQLGFAVLAAATVSRVQLSGTYLFNSGSWILGIISIIGITAYALKMGFGVETFLVSRTQSAAGPADPDNQPHLIGLAFEPNIMGSLAVGWLGALYYKYRIQGTIRAFPRMAIVPILISVVLSGTRAAWVAILIMAIIGLISFSKRSPAYATIAVLAIVAALFFVLNLLWSRSASNDSAWMWRVTHLLDAGGGTGLYRADMWRLALSEVDSLRHSLFWGTGANSFSQFHQVDATGVGAPYLSSLWIGLLYDTGLFGLTLFGFLLLRVAKLVPRFSAAAPMFVGLAICATVTNLVWFAYPWVFVALLLKMRQPLSDETPPHPYSPIRSDQLERTTL